MSRKRGSAHRFERKVEPWIVTAILHDAACMRRGGAVPTKQRAGLGEREPEAHMGKIHCNLAQEDISARPNTEFTQIPAGFSKNDTCGMFREGTDRQKLYILWRVAL